MVLLSSEGFWLWNSSWFLDDHSHILVLESSHINLGFALVLNKLWDLFKEIMVISWNALRTLSGYDDRILQSRIK